VLETKTAKRKRQMARWKRAEDWLFHQLEGKLGLKRWGHIRRGTACPDLVDSVFSYDVTTTDNKLAYITKEMGDAAFHAAHAGENRTPVLFIFPNDRPNKEGFVIYLVGDWLQTHGDG